VLQTNPGNALGYIPPCCHKSKGIKLSILISNYKYTGKSFIYLYIYIKQKCRQLRRFPPQLVAIARASKSIAAKGSNVELEILIAATLGLRAGK